METDLNFDGRIRLHIHDYIYVHYAGIIKILFHIYAIT